MIPTKLQKLEKELQYKGYKLTKQRKIVIEVLLEKEKEHLSAEEIFDLANKKDSNIGLATIYRTLELFEKLRILDKVNFLKDNTALYDLREKKNQHFHTHLICDKCGNVFEIEEDLFKSIEADLAAQYNFLVLDHKAMFSGLCENCRCGMSKKTLV